jgi:hypothetical protein
MKNPTIILGDENWSIKEDFTLGYSINSVTNKFVSRDISVVRTSDAWRTTSQGYLQRTPWNLIRSSEDFSTADWNKTNVTIVSNVASSPIGDLTADLVIPTTTNGEHNVVGTGVQPGAPITTPETVTIYAKSAGFNFLAIRSNVNSIWTASFFNLSTGVVSPSALFTTSTIEDAGNGWYLCRITYSGRTANGVQIIPARTNGVVSFTGDGISGVYLWGAQVVEGNTPLEYLRTINRQDFLRIDFVNNKYGMLLEQSSSNVMPISENFPSTAWTKSFASFEYSNEIAPNGLTGTTKMTATGATGSVPELVRSITTTSPFASIYVKPGNVNTVNLWTGGSPGISFTLTGSGSTSNPNVATIESIYNGWYRIGCKVSNNQGIDFYWVKSSSSDEYVWVWGAQLEPSINYPTSYIPNPSTGSIVRAVDRVVYTGVTGFIGQTEGTIYLETTYQKITSNGYWLFRIDDGTENNRIGLFSLANTGNLTLNINRGGVSVDIITYTDFISLTNGGRAKMAIAYKNGDFALVVNGAIVGTSSNSGAIPATSTIRMNSNVAGSALNGNYHVLGSKFYDERLSNDDLITITNINV